LNDLERKGQILELGFCFLFVPLVVSTMDRPPLMLGGRILLWGGLLMLLSLQSQRDGGELNRSLRQVRLHGWLPALALLLGLGSVIQFGTGHLGLWAPPARMSAAGPWASLLMLVAFTLTTAVPMEIALRAYLPRRFPGMRPELLGILLMPVFYLSSWDLRSTTLALVGGIALWLLSRTRVPLWMLPVAHGLGAWSAMFVHLP
jgi:hypothetical protein